MNVACLDFETANQSPCSACSVGIALFDECGQIVTRYEQFLLPHRNYRYFDPFNTVIHGIRAEDVALSPEFPEVAEEIFGLLHGSLVVAHNAMFDMNVLYSLSRLYRIPLPEMYYFCTCKGARRMWKGLPNHKLNTLCDLIGHRFDHHQAGADAEAAGKVFFAMLKSSGRKLPMELPEYLQIIPGRFYNGDLHEPCRCIPIKKKKVCC